MFGLREPVCLDHNSGHVARSPELASSAAPPSSLLLLLLLLLELSLELPLLESSSSPPQAAATSAKTLKRLKSLISTFFIFTPPSLVKTTFSLNLVQPILNCYQYFSASMVTKRPFALFIAVAIPPGIKRVRTISKIPRIKDPVGPCNHRSGTKAIDCVEDAQSGINA